MEKFGLTRSQADDERLAADEQRSFDRFGEHLSAVLRAAGDAAAQIETEAREEAERILVEAHDQRAEIEKQADQIRAEAESYADLRRSEAATEAAAIVSEANQRALSVDEDTQRRQQALAMDISLAEDRLRQLAFGLHEAGGRLEELLAAPGDGLVEEAGRGDETLAEVLAPSRQAEDEAAT